MQYYGLSYVNQREKKMCHDILLLLNVGRSVWHKFSRALYSQICNCTMVSVIVWFDSPLPASVYRAITMSFIYLFFFTWSATRYLYYQCLLHCLSSDWRLPVYIPAFFSIYRNTNGDKQVLWGQSQPRGKRLERHSAAQLTSDSIDQIKNRMYMSCKTAILEHYTSVILCFYNSCKLQHYVCSFDRYFLKR